MAPGAVVIRLSFCTFPVIVKVWMAGAIQPCYITTLLHPKDASSLPADLVNTRYPPEILGCEDTSGRGVMVKGLISH